MGNTNMLGTAVSPPDEGPLPPDEQDRSRLREELDQTIFVDAGAGSGKTTELIRRVVNLVGAGIPLGEIAAITFTEAAASELRHRLRLGLEQALESQRVEHDRPEATTPDDSSTSERVGPPENDRIELIGRYEAGIEALEHAAIQTLHSFAQRILTSHSLEAGLPPGFEIADEVASTVDFQHRWAQHLTSMYDDRELWPTLRRALAMGITNGHLSDLARVLDDHYDRLPALPIVDGPLSSLSVERIVSALTAAMALADDCANTSDKLVVHLSGRIASLVNSLGAAVSDEALLGILVEPRKWTAGNWGSGLVWGETKAQVQALLNEAQDARTDLVAAARNDVILRLGVKIEAFVLESARRRQHVGKLSFHDLLTLCRNLLRSSPSARRSVGRQYRRLLLDEFQDTDPLQIEIATLIAGSITNEVAHGDGQRGDDLSGMEWFDIDVEPGRLFFVGDPKQSIYRFRRADIALFDRASQRHGSGRCELTSNFRTVPQILEWVNALFASLMPDGAPGQARFLPLAPQRAPLVDGPAVELLGGPMPKVKAQEIYRAAADDLADHILAIVDDGRLVGDASSGGTRPATFGDIVILVPSRVSVPTVTAALSERGVPYRLASASLVWNSEEISAVLAILRCVDDPGHEVAVVGALRSLLLGVSDAELLVWRKGGGEWTLTAPFPPGLADHAVGRAMDRLRTLHHERFWMTPDELMDTVVRRFGVMEFALLHGGEEAFDRVRFAVDQARGFVASQRADVRAMLEWIEFQSSETIRVSTPSVDDESADVVRIMTIHASKGLEFPVTVLAGLSTQRRGRSGVQVLWDDHGQAEVALRSADSTLGFDALVPAEEMMSDAERVRLLYVATTRAKDWLVVCAHHLERPPSSTAAMTAAEQIWTVSMEHPELWTLVDRQSRPMRECVEISLPAVSTDAEIASERESLDAASRSLAALVANSPPRIWSATGIAARGMQHAARIGAEISGAGSEGTGTSHTGSVDVSPVIAGADVIVEIDGLDTPADPVARRRGRAGTAIGRAVHATLQVVDLVDPQNVDAVAQVQASAEGVDGAAATVERLANVALTSDTLRRAAARPHWPEMYVAAPVPGLGTSPVTIEGYIDLLVDDGAGGYEIIDYKTDAVRDEAAAIERSSSYRLQAAAYAWLVETVTSKPVSRATLLFVGAHHTIPIEITDLRSAIDEVLNVVSTA